MLVTVIHNNDVAKAVLKQYKAVAKADFKTPDYEHYAGVYDVVPDKTLQTLDTSEKYVEQDITVQPIPDEYADVSDTTALAQDVRRGKYFYDAEGVRTFGDLRDYAGDYSIDPSHVVQTLQTQNKFLESNVTVAAIPGNLVDVSDTTVLAADVLSGKVFHLANGSEATGNIATYSGSNTFTPSESSQTVQTASKYVETNISIAPIPSAYADVSGVTAQAADVELGKYFVTAAGLLTAGTLNKLEFESGTWSPSADIGHASIPFANTHTNPPAIYIISDIGTDVSPNSSGLSNVFIDYERITGYPLVGSATQTRYVCIYVLSRNDSGSVTVNLKTVTTSSTDPTDSTSDYSRWWADATAIKPYAWTGRNWIANRTYKWIAIWV